METTGTDDDVVVVESGPDPMQTRDRDAEIGAECIVSNHARVGLRVIKEAYLMPEEEPLNLSYGLKRRPDSSSPARNEPAKRHLSAIPRNSAPVRDDEPLIFQEPVVNLSNALNRPTGQQEEMSSPLNNSVFAHILEPPVDFSKAQLNGRPSFQMPELHSIHHNNDHFAALPLSLSNLKRLTESAVMSFASFPFGYLLSWMKSMEQRRLEDLKTTQYLWNQVAILTEKLERSEHWHQADVSCTYTSHSTTYPQVQENDSGQNKTEISMESSVPERGAFESVTAEANQSDFCDDDGSVDDDVDTESTETNDDRVVYPKLTDRNDDSNHLPEEITEFIENCRQTMKTRGLTYNDVLGWSKSRFYFLNICKISQFLNRRLNEAKSREMMTIMKEFLEHEPKLLESGTVQLPEDVERFIDESRDIMRGRGLSGMDFVGWTRDHFPVGLHYSSVSLFMNKRLNEEKSRAMIPILKLFLGDESACHRRLRSSRIRERFSPDQVVVLTEALKRNMYPSRTDFDVLAKRLKTTRIRVKRWFMNKRQKFSQGK